MTFSISFSSPSVPTGVPCDCHQGKPCPWESSCISSHSSAVAVNNAPANTLISSATSSDVPTATDVGNLSASNCVVPLEVHNKSCNSSSSVNAPRNITHFSNSTYTSIEVGCNGVNRSVSLGYSSSSQSPHPPVTMRLLESIDKDPAVSSSVIQSDERLYNKNNGYFGQNSIQLSNNFKLVHNYKHLNGAVPNRHISDSADGKCAVNNLNMYHNDLGSPQHSRQSSLDNGVQPQADASNSLNIVSDVITGVQPLTDASNSLNIVSDVINGVQPLTDASNTLNIVSDVINGVQPLKDASNSLNIVSDVINGVQPLTDASNSLNIVSDAIKTHITQPHILSLNEWTAKGKSKESDILISSPKGVYTKADRDVLLRKGHVAADSTTPVPKKRQSPLPIKIGLGNNSNSKTSSNSSDRHIVNGCNGILPDEHQSEAVSTTLVSNSRGESDYSPIWKYSSQICSKSTSTGDNKLGLSSDQSSSESKVSFVQSNPPPTKQVVNRRSEVIYETVYPTDDSPCDGVRAADLAQCGGSSDLHRMEQQAEDFQPPPLPPRTKSLGKSAAAAVEAGTEAVVGLRTAVATGVTVGSGHRLLERCMALPLSSKKRHIAGPPPLDRLTKPQDQKTKEASVASAVTGVCTEKNTISAMDIKNNSTINESINDRSLKPHNQIINSLSTSSNCSSLDPEENKPADKPHANGKAVQKKAVLSDDLERLTCVSRTSSGGDSIQSEPSVRPKQGHHHMTNHHQNGTEQQLRQQQQHHRHAGKEDSFPYNIVDVDEISGSLSSLGSSVSIGCLDNRFESGAFSNDPLNGDLGVMKIMSLSDLSQPGSVCSEGNGTCSGDGFVLAHANDDEIEATIKDGLVKSIVKNQLSSSDDNLKVFPGKFTRESSKQEQHDERVLYRQKQHDERVLHSSSPQFCCFCHDIVTVFAKSSAYIDQDDVDDELTLRDVSPGAVICSNCSLKCDLRCDDIASRTAHCVGDPTLPDDKCSGEQIGCTSDVFLRDRDEGEGNTRSPSPHVNGRLTSDSSNRLMSDSSTRQLSQNTSDSSHQLSGESSARNSDSFPGPDPYWGPELEGHIRGGSDSTCMVQSLASSTSSSVFASPTAEKKDLLDVEDLLHSMCNVDAAVLSDTSCAPISAPTLLPSGTSTITSNQPEKNSLPLTQLSFMSNDYLLDPTNISLTDASTASILLMTSGVTLPEKALNTSQSTNVTLNSVTGEVYNGNVDETVDDCVEPAPSSTVGEVASLVGVTTPPVVGVTTPLLEGVTTPLVVSGPHVVGVTTVPVACVTTPPVVPPHRPHHKLLKSLVHPGCCPPLACLSSSLTSATLPHTQKPLPPERTTSERRVMRLTAKDDKLINKLRRRSDNCVTSSIKTSAFNDQSNLTVTDAATVECKEASPQDGPREDAVSSSDVCLHPKLSRAKVDSGSDTSQ